MSIIRPTLRPSIERIFIGLLALTAVAALFPAAAGAGRSRGPHLVFRLSGKERQDVIGAGSIKVRGRCPTEACTVVASATGKSPSVHTGRTRIHIAAGAAATIVIPLPPRQGDKLQAALEAGHSPTLTVKATARDHAGTRVPVSLEVRPRKP